MKMKTIGDIAVEGHRVLVRADLNVPLDSGRVMDDGRIRASLPTLTELTGRGARVIICAHLGRPGGHEDMRYSLAPVAARLAQLLGHEVAFPGDIAGPAARSAIAAMGPGDVVMLENLRFNEAETSKDDMCRGYFADQLATPADLYVADGFGAMHRKHASVYDVPLRMISVAGVPGPGRGHRAAPADRADPAAVRGGARRRQGGGQVRRVRQPDRQGGPDPGRRGDGLPVPRRPGPQDRHLPARGEPGRRGRTLPRAGGARPDRPAVRSRRGDRDRPRTRRTRWWPPTRSRPTRWAWTSARSRRPGSPPPSGRPGRSSGTARWACSSWPRTPRAPGPWPGP